MSITRITPVLRVPNVAKSIQWYHDMLGFCTDPFPDKPPYLFAILRHGDSEIMLRRGTPPTRPKPKKYDWDIYLRLDDMPFRELFAKLQKAGVVTRRMEQMFYGLAEFEITDPDGYVLCLAQSLEDPSDLPSPEF
jgi:uncharacterized glyoxalase superfamily protein PhnB